ncbi:MAG: UDP-N-acetylmuramoyl-L-alanyl-D-glutamate--2,6-diaminopimelate ligase [bacterium]|nr:UDP-N-acetylmuramoyl-L-alanyl-D-glutamate--2,6-diaminopimelate ligase [bacterium]
MITLDSVTKMKLSQLLEPLGIKAQEDKEIEHISDDSRKVEPNTLFFAIKGVCVNGHRFIQEAKNKGAVAFIVEEEDLEGTIKVEDGRKALSLVAQRFFGEHSLKIIGITGTDGKTTTAFLIEKIFERAGIPISRLSTIGHRIGDRETPATQTTPSPIELQSLLKEAKDSGSEACVMEVSSHSLSQDRVYGMKFWGGIFTNLSSDHLDYHKTKEAYLEAKRELFLSLCPDSYAFVNADDPSSTKIIEGTKAKVIKFGIKQGELRPETVEETETGIAFLIYGERIKSRLFGIHNLYNMLGSIAASHYYGIPIKAIKEALKDFSPPKGRFEIISHSPKVIIDYAHTPQGLSVTLKACWQIKPKRVILLFGCGGDRDRQKRPQMGRIAEELADVVILTSDNPRYEDPEKILDEIEKGMKKKHLRISDRSEAIEKAISLAGPDDLVLIAGKGHEGYQIIGDKHIEFSDKEEALRKLATVQIVSEKVI